MDAVSKQLLLLQHCPIWTWKDQYRLLKSGAALQLGDMDEAHLAIILQKPIEQAALRLAQFHSVSVSSSETPLLRSSAQFISITDPLYPPSLKHISQPPFGLFVAGNPALLSQPALAVVGSRYGDQYGRRAIEKIVPPLAKNGIAIISGLAKGIDSFSHEAALQCGGKTIGVIAGGFNHFYPKENVALAKKVAQHGVVVSEYPPDRKPARWQFPARNRIISGLSKGVLVVQAAEKSGSLITAEYAMEEGKDVFAVPGPVDHPLSKGVHDLIADGAKLTHSAADILTEWVR